MTPKAREAESNRRKTDLEKGEKKQREKRKMVGKQAKNKFNITGSWKERK